MNKYNTYSLSNQQVIKKEFITFFLFWDNYLILLGIYF